MRPGGGSATSLAMSASVPVPASASVSGPAPATSPTASGAAAPAADSRRILVRWLIGLRWVVFGVLAATLPLGDSVFGFHVNLLVAAPAIGAVVLVNLWTQRRLAAEAPLSATAIALGVAFDVAAIAVVLAGSGGAANPFSALFFVHVALAASLLPARTTFALLAFATAAFGSLFLLPTGACCPSHPSHGAFSNHLYGMLLAFALCGALVAYFLTRVRDALEERGREIDRLRRRSEEGARFAALGTLAAGTAHELATPLATIGVLAGEIVDGGAAPPDVARSASSIGAQVRRCREVLAKMQAGARRAAAGGASAEVGPAVAAAVAAWRAGHPETAVVVRAEASGRMTLPLAPGEVEAALCALLDNAHHATRAAGSAAPIEVVYGEDGGLAFVRVDDAGTGVPPELSDRLGEPFLTTKQPGEGMGLGLYLVRKLLDEVGGRLEIAPRRPGGTSVRLYVSPVVA